MTLPTAVSQPTGMPSGPAGSMPLNLGQPVMGINLVGPVGGAAAQASSGFMPTYPANQVNGETAYSKQSLKVNLGNSFSRDTEKPWLVWLSGLSAGLPNQRVTGSIPSQGTCLGCSPGPQWGGSREASYTLMFLPFFFPLPSHLSKVKIIFKKKNQRYRDDCWIMMDSGGEN